MRTTFVLIKQQANDRYEIAASSDLKIPLSPSKYRGIRNPSLVVASPHAY